MIKIFGHTFTIAQLLAIGFAGIILVGALLLMLPLSNRDGNTIPFINALLTATSATCVTGLVAYDTYTQFSTFGHVVIITLIQIGGLGFMSFAVMISVMVGRKIGLQERSLMRESLGATKLQGVIQLVKTAVYGTLIIEAIGALILMIEFIPDFGLWRGIWYGVFHSISSFCNAGFDLIGIVSPGSSLSIYVDNFIINFAVTSLIIIGGLGFIVWDDIIVNKFRFARYRLQSKIVLSMTAILLVVGTILFWFIEKDAAFADLSGFGKWMAAYFQSTTTRTAGYFSIDQTKFSHSSDVVSIILMAFGASPGSTGGGMKTTTTFVAIMAIVAYLRGRDGVNAYNRKIETESVLRAFVVIGIYLIALFVGVTIICFEGVPSGEATYEMVSALSTVGLSKNLTPTLNTISKATICIGMYFGRVGTISFFMAMTERRIKTKINHAEEKVIIG